MLECQEDSRESQNEMENGKILILLARTQATPPAKITAIAVSAPGPPEDVELAVTVVVMLSRRLERDIAVSNA